MRMGKVYMSSNPKYADQALFDSVALSICALYALVMADVMSKSEYEEAVDSILKETLQEINCADDLLFTTQLREVIPSTWSWFKQSVSASSPLELAQAIRTMSDFASKYTFDGKKRTGALGLAFLRGAWFTESHPAPSQRPQNFLTRLPDYVSSCVRMAQRS